MICGNNKLKLYQVAANAQKCFCINCGTPIYNINPKYSGLKILHFGTIPDLKYVVPKTNIYCESKLEWVNNLNSIESFPICQKLALKPFFFLGTPVVHITIATQHFYQVPAEL